MSAFGGWAIGKGLFEWMKANFYGQRVVEFGSGSGSVELAKVCQLISFEHDPNWTSKGDGNVVIFAPIVDGWYDRRVVETAWRFAEPRCVIVDGPPAAIGRRGVLEFLRSTALDWRVNRSLNTVVFDDTDRPVDEEIALEFAAMATELDMKHPWQKRWVATKHEDGNKCFTTVECDWSRSWLVQ